MDDRQKGETLIYQTEAGGTKIDVFLEDGTVWLSQTSVSKLFQTTHQNITMHVQNTYKDNELNELATGRSLGHFPE